MARRVRKRVAPRDPAQEYLILVGAPSNSFNGWGHFQGTVPPRTWIPHEEPPNASEAAVTKYLRGAPAEQDVTWEFGTHDRYWADFLYAAIKLVETGAIRPRAGDIVTFMVQIDGYIFRDQVDWEASPYNPINRLSSWVVSPYNRRHREDEQGRLRPPFFPEYPEEKKDTLIPPSTAEHDINNQILMMTTKGDEEVNLANDAPYMRQLAPSMELQIVHDLPQRLVRGDPFWTPGTSHFPGLKGVQVKLLLWRGFFDLFDYIKEGTFSGNRWRHMSELIAANDEWKLTVSDGWYARARPGNVIYRDWETTPNVDRNRVKIRRFDYFGHSSQGAEEDFLFPIYGWSNRKGEDPRGYGLTLLRSSQFDDQLEGTSVFTPDSFGQFWGCRSAKFMAPTLAKYIHKVRATFGRTTYEQIRNPRSMPVPSDPAFPFIDFVQP